MQGEHSLQTTAYHIMVELTLLSRQDIRNMTSRRDIFRHFVEYILLPALGLWRVKPAVQCMTYNTNCRVRPKYRAYLVQYSVHDSMPFERCGQTRAKQAIHEPLNWMAAVSILSSIVVQQPNDKAATTIQSDSIYPQPSPAIFSPSQRMISMLAVFRSSINLKLF